MIRTIVFLTDFTDTARRAGLYAAELAMKMEARLIVLHFVEPVLRPGAEEDETLRDFSRKLEEKARSKIDSIVAELRRSGLQASGQVFVEAVFEGLKSFAVESGADLIVMGSHGIVQGREAFVGTLSHKVFFFSRIPVLFVR